MKNRMPLQVISILLILILAGCAPTPEKSGSMPESQQLGDITLAMHTPTTLHPLKTKLASNVLVFDLLYDSLVYVDQALRPVPYLLESCTISPDGMTIDCTLHDQVQWHDGAAFTATDVAHTVNTIREIGPEGIYYDRLTYIAGVDVKDMLHFAIRLTKPHVTVLNLLDFPIIPCHRNDLDTTMVGTGQYKLESFTQQKGIMFVRNEDWKLSAPPVSEHIYVSFMGETADEANMVRIGEVTAVTASLKSIGGLGIGENMKITKYPTLEYEYIGFNMSNPLLASYRVRYAVSYALRREKLIEAGFLGYGTPVCVPVPPSSYLYIGDEDKKQYDGEKVKSLLYEEGFGDTNGIMTRMGENGSAQELRLTLLVNEENEYRQKYAALAAEQLSAVGMMVTVVTVPWEEYLRRLSAGEYDMYAGGCRLSQDLCYDFLWGEEATVLSGYVSEEMTAAMQALGTPRTDEGILNAYINFENVFLRDLPIVGICFLDGAFVHTARLTGVENLSVSKIYRNIGQWSTK